MYRGWRSCGWLKAYGYKQRTKPELAACNAAKRNYEGWLAEELRASIIEEGKLAVVANEML
jgi:hypothetical protein